MNARIRRLVRYDLKQIINDTLDYEIPTIVKNTNLKNDLGMDGIYIVELIMKIEEIYYIKISDKDARSIETFDDVLNLLIKLIK